MSSSLPSSALLMPHFLKDFTIVSLLTRYHEFLNTTDHNCVNWKGWETYYIFKKPNNLFSYYYFQEFSSFNMHLKEEKQ